MEPQGKSGTTISIFNARTNKVESVSPITKTDAEWKEQLTPEQFSVARKQGTEYPFTGKYHNWKEPGIYSCICCGTDLFLSDTKFDSHTGWPSFYAPVSPLNVRTHTDTSGGMERTEVLGSPEKGRVPVRDFVPGHAREPG
jgi:peptide-methionine (R)-S-oxide reductase